MKPFFKTDSNFLLFLILVWVPICILSWSFVVLRVVQLDDGFDQILASMLLLYAVFGPVFWRLFVTGLRP